MHGHNNRMRPDYGHEKQYSHHNDMHQSASNNGLWNLLHEYQKINSDSIKDCLNEKKGRSDQYNKSEKVQQEDNMSIVLSCGKAPFSEMRVNEEQPWSNFNQPQSDVQSQKKSAAMAEMSSDLQNNYRRNSFNVMDRNKGADHINIKNLFDNRVYRNEGVPMLLNFQLQDGLSQVYNNSNNIVYQPPEDPNYQSNIDLFLQAITPKISEQVLSNCSVSKFFKAFKQSSVLGLKVELLNEQNLKSQIFTFFPTLSSLVLSFDYNQEQKEEQKVNRVLNFDLAEQP